MIVGQYEQSDKMATVALKMQDESTSAIEQQRDRMVFKKFKKLK